jgi:glycosyltransferase involved in cell wall biosynthesis
VVSILPVPFVSLKWVRKLNARRLIHAIQTTLERHKLVQPILLTTSPLAGSIVHHVGERLSIYYCMDEFSLWPGIDTHLIRSEEQSLINSVDAVIVTAQTLQQTKVPPSGFIQTITHGVHASHFSLSTATSREVALSDFIKVAYFGLIDERLDQKLLCDVLNRNSNIKLCMIGPVKTDVDELKQHERVEFKGFVAYSSLPSVISDIDVFVLPYKVDALSDFINPLKLKEYLATGRPVVATPISEVCKLASYLSVAGSAELFEKEIVTAARSPNKSKIDAAKALAYSESWETKAEELSAFIQRLERKC